MRIVWTRLICRACAPCVSWRGQRWRREGLAGRRTLLLKQGFGRRLLQPATCHRSIHNEPPGSPSRSCTHKHCRRNRQTRKSSPVHSGAETHTAPSQVSPVNTLAQLHSGEFAHGGSCGGSGRLSVSFLQLLTRGGLVLEMCFCKISI